MYPMFAVKRMVRDSSVVYVVDDDEAVRESTRMVLESYGMTVKTYESRRAFLADPVPTSHACLLLDQHMPDMTGLELLEILQTRRPKLPTIMISARTDAVFRDRAQRSGVAVLLDKPVADDDLVEA